MARQGSKAKNNRKKRSSGGSGVGLVSVVRERLAAAGEAGRTWFTGAGVTRWIERAAWALVIVGLVVGWTFGVPRLAERARDTAVVDAVRVQLVDPPAWLDERTLERIEQDAAADLRGDPFDRDELVTAGRVVHASGWFEAIDQVRRTAPDLIQVHGQPLRPFAFVRTAGRDQLIDVAGRRLPHELPPTAELSRASREGLAVITGVASPPPPGIAPRWEGAELQAALILLRQLETRPWRNQVTIIDASQFTRDGTLDFVTDSGSRFKWGSPPGAEKPLEPTAARKLEMLDIQQSSHPSQRIDRGERLRWWFFDDALTAERVGG